MESDRKGSMTAFPITLLFMLLLVCLTVTLLISKPPLTGVMEQSSNVNSSPAWTFGYLIGQQPVKEPSRLQNQLELRKDIMFWAGAASLAGDTSNNQAGANRKPASRLFFPVWDDGTPAFKDQYGELFPHIPEEQLKGYGRTAYFVDYGEARFWFLNSAKLAEEPSTQLDWLKRTAAENPQLHRIVLLQKEHDPMQPEVWDRLAESGADLVLIGARLYAPEAAVTARPQAGYRSSAHPGWAEWTMSSPSGGLLIVQGQGSRLEAALPLDQAGRAADRLELDAAALRQPAAVQERAPISIGAMWRYRAGGPEVRAEVPPGLDLTGETPTRSTARLPREDWRSPEYNDASWRWAAAPFGRSTDSALKRSIRTPLAVELQSPAYYFRKSFVLDEGEASQAITEWLLHISFEDGFIAYLNGVEIARDSIREGLVDYRSLAVPHNGGLYETISLGNHRNLLVQGANTLAVEIHTSHPDSPDMWFDLSLSYKK
ncbi:hypothetical protein GC093_28430 [Paenibacillus sp. LMG 31456]|uniref:Uncharacterized protein n=1 Tax=Paenibacillus foliorum TaxID=2654974 RepID=A0A972GUX9_9BACL|nr:hypothetical protein [Paenibacillus foliorum]NOU97122.1 hypothetical protein [Paenibacillus foliorum]